MDGAADEKEGAQLLGEGVGELVTALKEMDTLPDKLEKLTAGVQKLVNGGKALVRLQYRSEQWSVQALPRCSAAVCRRRVRAAGCW